MKLKKILFILTFSICFSSAVHGMEIAKDIIKNEVIPAAAIVATGAALGAASNIVYNTIDNFYSNKIFNFKKQSLKESLVFGAALSLPILSLARFGYNETYPEISPSKCALLVGIPFAIGTGVFAGANYFDARKMAGRSAERITQGVQSIRSTDMDIVRLQLYVTQILTAASLSLGYHWMIR